MALRIFLTGGSGFVGTAVIDELCRRGHFARALLSRGKIDPRGGRVELASVDLFDRAGLAVAMGGCDAVIHLVGIILERPGRQVTFERMHVEATRCVVDAARSAGVRRYVHMSAAGARAEAPSAYHRTKYQAEQYVIASGLDYTIFRPSLIYGPRSEFMKMEEKWARGQAPPYLFMPYFAGGMFGERRPGLLQPVVVEDVGRAFVDAVEKAGSIGQVYDLGGKDRVSWPELHQIAARAFVGRGRLAAPFPAWLAMGLTRVVPAGWLPFNRDQVLMSLEDNVCEMGRFVGDFGWEPRGIGKGIGVKESTLGWPAEHR